MNLCVQTRWRCDSKYYIATGLGFFCSSLLPFALHKAPHEANGIEAYDAGLMRKGFDLHTDDSHEQRGADADENVSPQPGRLAFALALPTQYTRQHGRQKEAEYESDILVPVRESTAENLFHN